jgi:hypothetical protein
MEEILICDYCKAEYSLLYEDDQVVAATKCRCEDKNKVKVLDKVLNQMEKYESTKQRTR